MKTQEIGNYELQQHNPWWINPEFIREDVNLRELLEQRYIWQPPMLKKFPPDENGIVTVRGPRQVGKTTFLKLLIKQLLADKKIPSDSIFFFSCDRIADYNELYTILSSYLDYARPRVTGRVFCFLDEISFVEQWQRALKSLADEGRLKNALVLLTGSNAIDLKISAESMPGRRGEILHPDWQFLPLDFSEFLALVAPEIARMHYEEAYLKCRPELKKLFNDYLICGGFMSAINKFYTSGFIPSYIYELYWSWVEGDLFRFKKSPDTALAILGRIGGSMSSTTSFYRLARESGVVSHATSSEYVDLLKRMFVCTSLDCYVTEQKRKDLKKNKKIYLRDPFIYSTVTAVDKGFLDDAFTFAKRFILDERKLPAIAEMCVAEALERRFTKLYYGMTGSGEIDFVTTDREKNLFFEVKYSDNFDAGGYKSFNPIFITKNILKMDGEIAVLPLEIFLGFTDQIVSVINT